MHCEAVFKYIHLIKLYLLDEVPIYCYLMLIFVSSKIFFLPKFTLSNINVATYFIFSSVPWYLLFYSFFFLLLAVMCLYI